MNIVIESLNNCPHHIQQLAKIWHETLGNYFPEIALCDIEKKLHAHRNTDTLPLTFVAIFDEKPVGMCSLRETEGLRPDLAPRVSSLVVSPTHQRRGIGRMLMNAVLQKARALGFEKIYLYAFDPIVLAWYERMEWQKIGNETFDNRTVTLMSFDLKL